MCRGAPGGGAAGLGGDAGTAEAILTDAIEENLRDGQESRSGETRQWRIQQR
jgi:hypothetical protein